MVGPNFKHPKTVVETEWILSDDPRIDKEMPSITWWSVFQDPLLEELIELAYRSNLDLQLAGLRVIEARAQRGIAVGEFFPQFQQIEGSHNFQKLSRNIANFPPVGKYYLNNLCFDISWELDLWGKFRRGIAAANANLYASVFNYDNVLVSLIADVAAAYIQICSFNEQIANTKENIKIIGEGYKITNIRYQLGDASNLDVQEALNLLEDTKSLVPLLILERRKVENTLCLLLGIPPEDLDVSLKLDKFVPKSPSNIIVGAPCSLVRRRPDIQRAEALAFAQCQEIGIAISDMLPNFSLEGLFGYSAESTRRLVIPSSSQVNTGIGLNWNVLNYGRLINNVYVQDTLFKQAIVSYQSTVLRAFKEVEDGMVGFIETQNSVISAMMGVEALQKAAQISLVQYRLGLVDYINIFIILNRLVLQQNNLAILRAEVALSLIATQKALGGGWEIRNSENFSSASLVEERK